MNDLEQALERAARRQDFTRRDGAYPDWLRIKAAALATGSFPELSAEQTERSRLLEIVSDLYEQLDYIGWGDPYEREAVVGPGGLRDQAREVLKIAGLLPK